MVFYNIAWYQGRKLKIYYKDCLWNKTYIGFVVANLCSNRDQEKLINMLIVSISKNIFLIKRQELTGCNSKSTAYKKEN